MFRFFNLREQSGCKTYFVYSGIKQSIDNYLIELWFTSINIYPPDMLLDWRLNSKWQFRGVDKA